MKSNWIVVMRSEFRRLLPVICTSVSGSSAVRFFREVFRQSLDIDVLESGRHCRICTYPEGMLDTYLDEDGVCSACRMYHNNKAIIGDRENLREILRRKLDEMHGKFNYDAVLAFSGGKDSVYVLTRLVGHYNAKVLCVLDDLNQQTEQATHNAERAVKITGAGFRLLPPPACERDVRRNFLRAGESFCRLCLRSHLARIYEVALKERIPMVFFGLSPYQLLDCPDAIKWWLNAVKDVSAPLDQINSKAIVERYKQRTFQGSFERGFVMPMEKQLLQCWMDVFDKVPPDFAPLIVPFFLFDGYPDEARIMDSIAQEVGWERPEVVIGRHTNCAWLRPAGVLHKATENYHWNYRERAAELRFLGNMVSEEDARALFQTLDTVSTEESMSVEEFEQFLHCKFNLRIDDLPCSLQVRLKSILQE